MHTPEHTTPKVLLVGGAGYIGGHTALALHDAGIPIAIFDNFSTSARDAWSMLSTSMPGVALHEGDARDEDAVHKALVGSGATCVIHFAALKSVPESVHKPLVYHKHNSEALLSTLTAMERAGVRHVVFSSSAAVYGAAVPPIQENHALNPANPYGGTKAWAERILSDLCGDGTGWNVTALRYFNPVGADPAQRFGEWGRTAGNVAPLIAQAALDGSPFSITGADFNTPDGTGLRDYIHIADLAEAHKAAVLRVVKGFEVLNVGRGAPTSVLELVKAFEQAAGRTIDVFYKPRRDGDVAACWAAAEKAETVLGWKARHSLDDMARDTLRWMRVLARTQGTDTA